MMGCMKYVLFFGLTLTMAFAALPLFAQTTAEQRSHMEQIRTAERTAVLQALTPHHKVLLANVVGTLATADIPDVKSAVGELDDARIAEAQKMAALGGDGGSLPRGPRTDPGMVVLRHAIPDFGLGSSRP